MPAFRFTTLRPGLALWAVVSAVRPDSLTLALPGGLSGKVPLAEASDTLAEAAERAAAAAAAAEGKGEDDAMEEGAGDEEAEEGGAARSSLQSLFSLGQRVAAVVIKVTTGDEAPEAGEEGGEGASGGRGGPRRPRKGVLLSLRPARVMHAFPASALAAGQALVAEVRSVEDHGAVMSVGVAGVAAFLRNEDYAPAAGGADGASAAAPPPLTPGRLLVCNVRTLASAGSKRKTLTLACRGREATETQLKEAPGLTLDALLPGQLVSAKITAVLGDGLRVAFLTYFTGSIDHFHLADSAPGPDWAKKYAVAQRVMARVLYVDAATKHVGLTLRPHLVSGGPPPLATVGAKVDGAIVRRVDPKVGLLIELPPGEATGGRPGVCGLAHVSNLSDERLDKIEKHFKVGSVVRCRVIGQRPLEGLSSLSLKPSVLAREIFSVADLKPGALVNAVIAAVEHFGAIVELGGAGGPRALCPTAHLHESLAAAAAAAMATG